MPYAISGGHEKTIEAAEIILKQGGNAVDAAIAAYLVSFISEPCMASFGAGGFAMVNDTKEIKLVDFFCQTPKTKRDKSELDFYPIVVDFGNTQEEFHVGRGSIAVPGAIAGIYRMHDLWGKLPLKEIFEPALEWSKEGIAIDRFQAYDFELLQGIFKLHPRGRALFFTDADQLKGEGDLIKMPAYHDFLDALRHEGKDLFYKGEIARKVCDDLKNDGHLSRLDFEEYQVRIADPVNFDFCNRKIFTAGFPSVGGMMITALLNTFQDILNNHQQLSFLSVEHFQKLLETIQTIRSLNNSPQKISNFLIQQFGIHIPLNLTQKGHKWGGTSHFNVIDESGMTVCLTTSIGEGSGYFVEGTDMQMNNMLGEEALMPNGFHNWQSDVRLQSMMSPTIVCNDRGQTLLGIGSGGAGRIPYAISQALINILFFELDAEVAVEAPRIHIQDKGIEMESGFHFDEAILHNVNVWDKKSLFFGGTNLIQRKKNRLTGVADQRRYGAVIDGN